MNRIALAALPLSLLAATAAIACGPPKPARLGVWTPVPGPEHVMPNALAERADCTPIVRQVSGENRPAVGQRLDRQPPARALLAVDRQVDGCREVTFVNQRR